MSSIFIHKTAEVSDKARIGKRTKIWNQAQVREGSIIGEDCIDLYPRAFNENWETTKTIIKKVPLLEQM